MTDILHKSRGKVIQLTQKYMRQSLNLQVYKVDMEFTLPTLSTTFELFLD